MKAPPNAMNDTDAAVDSGELPDENPNRPREYHGARTVIAGAGVVLAVAAALWLTLLQPSEGGDGGVVELPYWLPANGLEVGSNLGQLAPDFELETLDGGRFRLSDWRGQPVLINFWASWCGPCRREVPALIRALDSHGSKGLTVVGVNIEESTSVAQDFVGEFGVEYPIPMDFDGAVFRAYGGGGPSGPPRSFFIDPDGVIVRIWAGQAPDEIVEEHTAEFADTYATGRVGQLPGIKSPPPADTEEDIGIGLAVGSLAPDMLLTRAEEPDRYWLLSGERGRPVTIAIVPPGCMRCADALGLEVARLDGAVLLLGDDQGTERLELAWTRDLVRVYGSDGDLQLIEIDERGVIRSISDTLE